MLHLMANLSFQDGFFFLFFIELGESTELDSDTPNSNMSICQLLEFIQYKCPLLTK